MSEKFIYVDETKDRGYLVAAAAASSAQVTAARNVVRALLLPGQRSLHMKAENLARKAKIADAIGGLSVLGISVVIYDAGVSGTQKVRRELCLAALVADATSYPRCSVVLDLDETLRDWDRQRFIELTREHKLDKSRLRYSHQRRHEELLLAVPDVVAWCWAKGGVWRDRVRPIVSGVRFVGP